MKFSRKITIYYSGILLWGWVTAIFCILILMVMPLEYELAILLQLFYLAFLLIYGLLGLALALCRRIPIELPLTTLYTIPLIVLSWGLKSELPKTTPIFSALILNCSVAVWYFYKETRERSGNFS